MPADMDRFLIDQLKFQVLTSENRPPPCNQSDDIRFDLAPELKAVRLLSNVESTYHCELD